MSLTPEQSDLIARYEALPFGVRETLRDSFERHLRLRFDDFGDEVLCNFLDQPEIAVAWADYREAVWEDELRNSSESWWEYLEMALDTASGK